MTEMHRRLCAGFWAGSRAALLAAGLAALLAGCGATNPATGRSQYTPFLSPAKEKKLGATEHPKILAEFGGAYDDPALAAYVEAIGRAVAAKSELPADGFTVTLLNTPMVNAFALPGGYVYVTRGLLALANSEAEIAGVLAHEIGHVTARHTAERYNRAVGGGLLATAVGVITGNKAVAGLAQLGAQGWLAGFSRDQEYEADSLGIRYMSRAGYQPMAQAELLQSLGNHDRLQKRLNPGLEGGPSFLATHPQTPDRVRRAIRAARAAGAAGDAPLRRDAYLDRIDGMVFGDHPDLGLVRGRRFSHPVMRFTFEVPEGFRLTNGQRAVVAEGPDNALIVFDGEDDAELARRVPDMASYLTRHWGQKAVLDGVAPIQIGGLAAATASTRLNTRGGPMDARLVAIRFGPDRIYRLLMVTPPELTDRLATDLKRVTYSFRRLRPAEAAALKPRRVRVVTVRRGDTRATLARRMRVEAEPEAWFDTLNALAADARLDPGQRVKIVAY